MLVVFITSQEDLHRLVTQNPLIETDVSLEGINGLVPPAPSYFGVGLCNGGREPKLTQGMPIDVLMLILIAEYVGTEKYILVADLHARANGFDDDEIERTANRQKDILLRAIANLGFLNWKMLLASELLGSSSKLPGSADNMYLKILDSIDEQNEYVRKELCDMRWFSLMKGVKVKLGWALDGSRKSDERSFDRKYAETFGEGSDNIMDNSKSDRMSFIYTMSGRTFDPKRPRSAPYFCSDPETRLLLKRGEDVSRKFLAARMCPRKDAVNGYKNLLSGLMRMYNKLVEPTSGHSEGGLEDRVQYVIDRCTR